MMISPLRMESVPWMRARLLARPPVTSPMCASGTNTSRLTMGSSSCGRALPMASRKAFLPAVTKATSLESTGWYLPSITVTRTSCN